MDHYEIVVKESPGLCRCCLSEGCYKDLGTEYPWMNETEVYADMLLECFDIVISQHSDGPNGSNRLICEVCITRLRDACNFKKQVVDSERKFVDMLAKGEFEPKVVVYEAPDAAMKSEELLEDPEPEDVEVEYLEDLDFEDDLPLKQALEQSMAASASNRTSVKVKGKRGRPRKNQADEKVEKKSRKSDDKPRTSKALAKGANAALSSTKRNRLIKRNAIAILEHSNALPFKWHRGDYLCFYCHQNFKDFSKLKLHSTDHKSSNIKSAVTYLRRDEKVKIDVSELRCNVCQTTFDVIERFVKHLKELHNICFHEDYDLGVVPYRITKDYQCAVCSEKFQYFVKLNQHMNAHFGMYVCEACGKSFLSQDRLRCHSLSHGNGFHCSFCGEVFDSLTQRHSHEARIHNKSKLLQCLYCTETFKNYNERKRHHSTTHNIPIQEFTCPACNKIFHIASRMQLHIKEVHLREKNFACSMCEQKFFSKTHLQKHLVKHIGERIHTCEICKKSYARKQTLKDHMKIHSNDRKYVCSVCSQSFVQNNSLKMHMKVHHSGSGLA